MARKPVRGEKPRKRPEGKAPQVYKHPKETLLLRPDVGLQPQFKAKKPPKTYRYDPSLDPALSWDVNAERERGEALIARIEAAKDLGDAKAAAAELRRMSRAFLNWTGKAERQEFTVPTLPLFVHERLSTQAILRSVQSHKRDRQQTLDLFGDEDLDVRDRLLKAYVHPTPWVNRMVLGDSLVRVRRQGPDREGAPCGSHRSVRSAPARRLGVGEPKARRLLQQAESFVRDVETHVRALSG